MGATWQIHCPQHTFVFSPSIGLAKPFDRSHYVHPVVEALEGGPIEKLCCKRCYIDDVSVLANCNLPQLKDLILAENGVKRLPSLGNLSNLNHLDLCFNFIQTLPLEDITNLEELVLEHNEIETNDAPAAST